MYNFFKKKTITFFTIQAFILCTIFPGQEVYARSSLKTKNVRIFGWCKYKRLKKKVKELTNFIKELERGASYDEFVLRVAIFRKEINESFGTNFTVREIADNALNEIEKYAKKYRFVQPQRCMKVERVSFIVKEDIESFICSIEKLEESNCSLKSLKKHLKIHQSNSKSDKTKNGLEGESADTVFAYACIFCGALLCILPFPMAKNLGKGLIANGTGMLAANKFKEQDEKNREDAKRNLKRRKK